MRIQREAAFKNWSLKKMLFVFLVASILLTAIAVVSTEWMAVKQLELASSQSAKQYARDELSVMDKSLSNMRSALYVLANKTEIKTYLLGDSAYKFSNAEMVVSTLNDILRYIPQMANICVVTSQGQITESQLGRGLSIDNYVARRSVIHSLKEFPPSGFVSLPLTPAENGSFALAMAVPVVGVEGFCVSFSSIPDLLSNLGFSKHPFVISSGDTIIASNGLDGVSAKTVMNSAGSAMDIGGASYRLEAICLKTLDWDITMAYPQTELIRSSNKFVGWGSIYLGIFIISECILALLIYAGILQPIGNVHAQTMAIRIENGQIINPVQGKNELRSLAQGINAMIEQTNQMGQEMSRTKLSLVQTELEHLRARNMFLQAQINPHFLYNMLECICGMSTEENAPRTREMAMLLAQLYRYCVDKNEGTLEDELECVRIYNQIINLRYDEAYEIAFAIPEDLLVLHVPRMILEPVVENAIQHGFVRGHKKRGAVHISAEFSNNLLIIQITDNGCGMEQDRIDSLNQCMEKLDLSETEHASIGFFNVNSRIKLRYGENSGLRLENRPNGGLCVFISIYY